MHNLFEILSITLFLCSFCAFLWLKRTVFSLLLKKAVSMALWVKASRPIQSLPTYQVGLRNPWLINYLRAFGIFTLVESALQIGPFCSNKANFLKSQMNVNNVIIRGYGNNSNWTLGENKPNSNPIQTQYKANQTQLKPIKYQNKPNTKPNKANFRGKKMLLRLTINGLRKRVLIFYGKQSLALPVSKDVWEIEAQQTADNGERKEQE